MTHILINEATSIPLNEIHFTFSCSKGPGGQHVNKVNTRVTLWFDLSQSKSLTPSQKETISEKLSSRINKNGVLHLVSYKHRSQSANKTAVIEKFCVLVRNALKKKKLRKETVVPVTQKKKRMSAKKHRGLLKKSRIKADETQ